MRVAGARLAEAPIDSALELEAAWMLVSLALSHRERLLLLAGEGRLHCVPRYCRASLHAPFPLRRANEELGLLELERWPGIVQAAPGDESAQFETLHDKAGLCAELQRRADALADALRRSGGVPEAMLRELLPAVAPAGLGAFGNAQTEAHALALLESGFAALGLELDIPLELPRAGALPRRVGELRLEHPVLGLRWRRKHGLCWTPPGLRECSFVASLEVQGDGGGRLGFAATHPPRPRWFEVAHSQPSLHDAKTGALQLRRTISLPVDAHEPRGRHQDIDWTLTLWLDQQQDAEGIVDLDIELGPLVAGHRYRLALPVPFWPRPGVYPKPSTAAEPELWSHDGPQPPTAVLGTCSLACREAVLIATGAGLREVELLTRKNEQLLMLTLARCPEHEVAPGVLRRRFRLIWRRP